MKWNQFLGGLFIGVSLGLMVGAAIVRYGVSEPGKIPLFWCILLVLLAAIALRPSKPQPPKSAQS